ncbi:MAG: MFS transporter [Abditibacteriota bacterium]|nr:MFS transporter [Abditibacteriota bacterium]
MAPETKRWLILFAGFMTCLCESIMYATGVFMAPIMETYHISGNTAPAALVFSLLVVFIAVGTVLGGLINEKKGTKPPIVTGSVLFAAGLFLSALSAGTGSLWLLYASFGMITGTGVGMIYGSVLGVIAKWFPDRKGFATGVVVCAVGGGPVLLAPFAKWLLASFRLSGTYLAFGILTALIMAAASAVLNEPPADFLPAGAGAGAEDKPRQREYDFREMLGTLLFWLVAFMYMAGSFSGLMVISDAETVTRRVLERTALEGSAGAYAVAGIMVLAAANAFGRLFWSTLSDRIGRIVTLIIMFAITGCVMLLLTADVGFWPFMACMAVTGCCFGGYLGMFLPICSDFFGNRNITLNYGILYSAFALAGILGPLTESFLSFSAAALCAAWISFSGLAVAVLVQLRYAGKADPAQ